jgi:hypothetical protein
VAYAAHTSPEARATGARASERRDHDEQRAGEEGGEDYDTEHVLTRNCGCRQDQPADARSWHEAKERPPAPGAREHQIGDAPVHAREENPQHGARVSVRPARRQSCNGSVAISDSRRRFSLPPSFAESVCLAAASAGKQRPGPTSGPGSPLAESAADSRACRNAHLHRHGDGRSRNPACLLQRRRSDGPRDVGPSPNGPWPPLVTPRLAFQQPVLPASMVMIGFRLLIDVSG